MSVGSQEPSYDEFVADNNSSVEDNSTFTDTPAETAQPNTAPEPSQGQPENDTFNGHPAWKSFEDTLGPIGYRQIEPELRKMSQAFEAKIAASNRSLDPWKPFIDEKVDPQELVFARQYLQEINSDPMAFFTKLKTYLESTGQLEAAAQVADAAGIENENPVDPDEDPRLSAMEQRIAQFEQAEQARMQQMQQAYQEQQFAQQVAHEEQQLEAGVQAIKAKGGTDVDVRKSIDIATLHYHRTGKPISLEQAFEQWQAERGTILSQPRAVDSAPRLPSVSGGAPAQGQRDLSTASRSESRDTLAALLMQNRS